MLWGKICIHLNHDHVNKPLLDQGRKKEHKLPREAEGSCSFIGGAREVEGSCSFIGGAREVEGSCSFIGGARGVVFFHWWSQRGRVLSLVEPEGSCSFIGGARETEGSCSYIGESCSNNIFIHTASSIQPT